MTNNDNVSVKRVLLLDDDHDEHFLFRKVLQPLLPGVELVCEDNSRGYSPEISTQPDLAIVDINMPGENGFQWVTRIRKAGFTFPVMMYSNGFWQHNYTKAMASGATYFMSKPNRIEFFNVVLKQITDLIELDV